MSSTVVELTAGVDRARVTLRAGTVVPRLVSRGPRSAHVALVAGGALLLGGDAIDLRIVVGTGCSLELEEIGGTVAYDGEGQRATWDATVHVGEAASLTWHGLPFVVADGADVDRRTVVSVAASACLLLRETIVLGRTGERGGVLRTRTEVSDPNGAVLVESVTLDGCDPLPGIAGCHRVLDTIMQIGTDEFVPALVPSSPSEEIALLQLERSGFLLRALGGEAHRTDITDHWQRIAAPPLQEATHVVVP